MRERRQREGVRERGGEVRECEVMRKRERRATMGRPFSSMHKRREEVM